MKIGKDAGGKGLSTAGGKHRLSLKDLRIAERSSTKGEIEESKN